MCSRLVLVNEGLDLLDFGLSEVFAVVLEHTKQNCPALVVPDFDVDPWQKSEVVTDALVPFEDGHANQKI